MANRAEPRAPARVASTQITRAKGSGAPPMAMWDTAPVRAVNAMIKTLVPTAVFSS